MKNNNLKKILYILMLMIIIPIPYINFLFGKYIKVLQLIDILLILIIYIKDNMSTKNIIYVLLFLSSILFSNLLNSINLISIFFYIFRLLGIFLFFDFGMRHDSDNFILLSKKYFQIICLLNFLSILMYPNGFFVNADGYTSNWLLGFKNSHIEYILMSLTFSGIYCIKKYNKFDFNFYFNLIISIISTLLVKNSTGMVGMIIIIFYLIFKSKIDNLKIANALTYFNTYLLLFFSIVIFRIQRIFEFLIVEIMHKDLNFTGRIYVWDNAINYIKNRSFFGYGNNKLIYHIYNSQVFIFGEKESVIGAHNSLLDVTYKTGLCGLAVYILLIYKLCLNVMSYKTGISKFLAVIIFSYFIMMLMEAYSFELILILFAISCNLFSIIGSECHA